MKAKVIIFIIYFCLGLLTWLEKRKNSCDVLNSSEQVLSYSDDFVINNNLTESSNHQNYSNHQHLNQFTNRDNGETLNNEPYLDIESDELLHESSNEESCDTNIVLEDTDSLNVSDADESISGHRQIVNLEHILVELHRLLIDDHFDQNGCQFRDWRLLKIDNVGLQTRLFFLCQNCSYEDNFYAQGDIPGVLDLNRAAAAVTITSGTGYEPFRKILAAMNNNACLLIRT